MFWNRKKSAEIDAVCYYCKKTDFRANMKLLELPSSLLWNMWAHKECHLKAKCLMVCPHCKGVGEVPIEKEGKCVQEIK